MKILKITSFFHPVQGGMESHLLNETQELVKLKHKIKVLTSDCLRKGRIRKRKERINNVEIERLKTWFKLSYFTPFFPSVWTRVLTEDYDVLHINAFRQPHNLCILLAKLRGKKTVLSTHWPEYPKNLRSLLMNLIIPIFDKTLGKLILKATDRIIVQTKEEESWLKNKFNIKNKITIIPPGIDKKYLKKRNPYTFKNKHKIKGDIVLYLGRVHKSKGIDKIIKIASLFKKTNFIIVGSGPYLREIKNKPNNVKLIGKVSEEEKLQAYASCDLFIHPTNYDAFGITILEAMSQSKPSLGSYVGGVPSAISKGGLTFKKDSLTDLKDKLSKLLNNKKLREKLGKDGRKKVEDLTWEKLTKRLERVYKAL